MDDADSHPISLHRVECCRDNAGFWAKHMPYYADQMRRKADNFAIASASLAALTGLGVWGTVQTRTEWWAVALVSFFAFLASILAVIPQVKGYARTARDAAVLGPRYGHVYGDLLDAEALLKTNPNPPGAQALAQHAVDDFEAILVAHIALDAPPTKIQAARDAERQRKEKEKEKQEKEKQEKEQKEEKRGLAKAPPAQVPQQ
jgi:hypothetical protein